MTSRWNEYYHLSKGENPEYDTRQPNANEKKILKLLVFFQMTYLGAPMVYYGSEAGMYGANDPCCRKPMIWPDIGYENDATAPDGHQRKNVFKVSFDAGLHEHYRRCIQLRNRYEALQLGDYTTVLADDEKEILAFLRTYKGEQALVIMNNSMEPQKVKLPVNKGSGWKDPLTQETYKPLEGVINLELEELSGRVLITTL